MKRNNYPRSLKLNLVLGGTALFVMCCSMIFTLGPHVIKTTRGKLRGVLRSNKGPVEPFGAVQDEQQQPSDQLTKKTTLAVHSSHEPLAMGEDFYTSDFSANDTSTTIIFNVYRGEPEALHIQLDAALNQENVEPPNVWVMCFNSPSRHLYEAVLDATRVAYPAQSHRLVFTVSEFNHKFHGRFLLAYMATTKYVLIVDDDKAIDSTTVFDYIQYMNIKKGVWGNNGHLRAATFEGYKSWPTVGYDLSTTDMEEQDYLCGMWFLEQSWLEYFIKERPPSWATSEDMHLSHVMRKYLNLNTYGGKVALNATALPGKEYAATKGSALDLREFIFDHQLGRGNKVANVEQPLDSLVYAETVEDIETFIAKLDACPLIIRSFSDSPWCNAGRTAAVFRGAKEQNVNGLIAAAERLCAKTQCEYFSVKPWISHGIKYFNMREGYGQANTGVEIPFQTGASDVLTSLVGILNNVLPETLFVPDVASMRWPEAEDASKRNRLQIYHRTVLLAVDIHRNSKTNGKVVDDEKDEWVIADEFPSRMETLIWQRESTDDPLHYYSS